MPPTLLILDADPLPTNILAAWSFPIVPFITLAITLIIYLRGWRAIHQTRPHQLPPWRAATFFAGILSLWIALASPIDALDDYLLAAHMIQHFILMSIAPPLIILGAPAVPILRGLPRSFTRTVVGPLLSNRAFHTALRLLTHPMTAWLLMNAIYLGWHVPFMFELTFRSDSIHDFEHFCFFATSILFWWPIVQPWPQQSRFNAWLIILYLLTSDLVNTGLSAFLCFSGRLLYPSYGIVDPPFGLDALNDQIAAGAFMWVFGSLVFLAPAIYFTARFLTNGRLIDEKTGLGRARAMAQ